MKKITGILIAALLPMLVQAQLVVNSNYLVMAGGTQSSPSYLVLNDSAAAGIVRNGGWIISENEFNMVQWNIRQSTGTFTVPFGYSTASYLPVSVNLSNNPGVGKGNIKFSTYHTAALNSGADPSDVNNVIPFFLPGNPSNNDNSYNIVDRFYIIDANAGYTTKPAPDNITFSYISGTGNSEVSSPNTIAESHLLAQRYNSGVNNWNSWYGYGCTDAISNNVGTVQTGPLASTDFYRSWSLWDNGMSLPVEISATSNPCSAGTATATVLGGVAPYTYLWSDALSAATANAGYLSAGTYTVTVHDNHGCSSTASIAVTQSSPIVVGSWSIYNVACHGGNTGKAISTVYGGTMPYTYLWSNGQTTGTVSNVSAGTYTLKVTDKNGCTGTNSYTLTQPAIALTESIAKVSDLTCHELPPLNNPNGSATANPAGGTSPYAYSWLPSGGTLKTSVTLPAGIDHCRVTDAHGCTTTASITLGEPSLIFATFTKTIPACNGNSDGIITAAGTGGSGSYTNYVWSPYGGNHATASNLSAQTYTVTITDNTGCLGTASVGLGQPSVIGVTISGPTCTGNGGKGTIVANATGGTPAYHYTWSNGITTVGTAMRETFVNGSYTVTVGDGHNCPKASAYITFRLCPTELKENGDDKGDTANGGNDIRVYPNPTNGQFTIAGLEQGETIEMYDYTGRKISSQVTTDISQLTINNISSQPNGVYLIRILDKEGKMIGMKKVVKTQ